MEPLVFFLRGSADWNARERERKDRGLGCICIGAIKPGEAFGETFAYRNQVQFTDIHHRPIMNPETREERQIDLMVGTATLKMPLTAAERRAQYRMKREK